MGSLHRVLMEEVVEHKHLPYLMMNVYQLEVQLPAGRPEPNIFETKLIAVGIPIEASVPRNPPSICLRVGLITNRPPV